MKKACIIAMVAIFASFYACSEDSIPIIEIEEETELDERFIGSWSLDPTAGSKAVGPTPDDLSWWSIGEGDIDARSCIYDDLYIFGEDGDFMNEMGEETWLEEWQEGVDADGCGAPIAPHDGSTVGEWYTVDGDRVRLEGEGIFLGLSKVHNSGEDGQPENNRITYNFEFSDDDQTLEIRISGWLSGEPDATWYYRFIKQ
ncbi:MAG: hypothetical protein JJU46_11405 [Balneolaceae bacterium]|nr:hypothetical protein [Balneolaceae bacterium]MCH8547439.1 hypothetical protein [Balneolaceae bacterium]